MSTPAATLLAEFVLEKAAAEPLVRRVALYRALAATLTEASPAFAELTALADQLEEADHQHRQLLLRFRAD
jgi:hypothetical protein